MYYNWLEEDLLQEYIARYQSFVDLWSGSLLDTRETYLCDFPSGLYETPQGYSVAGGYHENEQQSVASAVALRNKIIADFEKKSRSGTIRKY